MFKKALIAFGLAAISSLSGCIVVAPHRAVVFGPPVIVPVFPVYGGWYGGYSHEYWGRGYGEWHEGGHRR